MSSINPENRPQLSHLQALGQITREAIVLSPRLYLHELKTAPIPAIGAPATLMLICTVQAMVKFPPEVLVATAALSAAGAWLSVLCEGYLPPTNPIRGFSNARIFWSRYRRGEINLLESKGPDYDKLPH